jgi:hypothetical protein
VGACGLVLSYQALNVVAFRYPGAGKAYPMLKAPGGMAERSCLPRTKERGGTG